MKTYKLSRVSDTGVWTITTVKANGFSSVGEGLSFYGPEPLHATLLYISTANLLVEVIDDKV